MAKSEHLNLHFSFNTNSLVVIMHLSKNKRRQLTEQSSKFKATVTSWAPNFMLNLYN